MKKEFREQVSLTFNNVDADSNMIKGVAVLRAHSENGGPKGRQYTQRALESVARFVSGGAKAFADHDLKNKIRSVRDLLGVFSNGRVDRGVVKGDLTVLENHKPWLMAMAKQLPSAAGMSIHGWGPSSLDRGTEVVADVTDLQSIDLVATPASTLGLFEGKLHNSAGTNYLFSEADLRQSEKDLADIELAEALGVKPKREKRETVELTEDERALALAVSDNNNVI